MKKLVTPFRVGLLVIVAGVFLFGFLLFVRKGGMAEDESLQVYAYFRDASGLGAKSRVQIAGIAVGEVGAITLEGTRARVSLRIRRDVNLRQDASITKRSESLLGDYLLDLNPGSALAEPMPEGGEIQRVLDKQGMEAIFESLSAIAGDVQQVTLALRNVLGGEKGTQSLEHIVKNLVSLSDSVNTTVNSSSERLETILRNFEAVSADVRHITHDNEGDVRKIVQNLEAVSRDMKSVLATVDQMVGSNRSDVQQSVSTLKQTIERLDRTLANVEEVTTRVKNGEGPVGALLSDERLAQRINETVEDVSDFTNRLTGIQTEVGMSSWYLLEQGGARNALSLRLIPKPDKYYLLEVVDDPRGVTEIQLVQTNPPGSGEPVVQRQKVTRDAFKISAQFAKRYYFATLRFGIIESTGGVGADLHFLDDALSLRMDLFNFSVEELRYPRLRAALRVQAFNRLFLTAGMDDILNSRQRDIITGRLVAGRDFFIGGGLYFTDEDLKALLPIVPTP